MAFQQSFSISYPNGCGSVRVTDTTTYGDGSSESQPSKEQLKFRSVSVAISLFGLGQNTTYSTVLTYDKDQTIFDLATPSGLSGLTFSVNVNHTFDQTNSPNLGYTMGKSALNTACILPL